MWLPYLGEQIKSCRSVDPAIGENLRPIPNSCFLQPNTINIKALLEVMKVYLVVLVELVRLVISDRLLVIGEKKR